MTGVCNNYGLNHLYWVTFYFCLFTFREDGRILRMMVHTYPHVYLLSELQCSQASKLWSSKSQKIWSFKSLKLWSSKALKLTSSKALKLRCSKSPKFQSTQAPMASENFIPRHFILDLTTYPKFFTLSTSYLQIWYIYTYSSRHVLILVQQMHTLLHP